MAEAKPYPSLQSHLMEKYAGSTMTFPELRNDDYPGGDGQICSPPDLCIHTCSETGALTAAAPAARFTEARPPNVTERVVPGPRCTLGSRDPHPDPA